MHPTFNTAFYKILNDDVCERTCSDKVLFYVANTFIRFDLSQCLCSRYHDIQKIGLSDKNKHEMLFFCAKLGSQGRFLLSSK